MKKFTKQISEIIIHCTATPAGRDLHVSDITRYHLQRGFDSIGYHYLVALDGTIEPGRPTEYIGAHCLGHNDRSIGVAYVGGVTADMTPADTRTAAQRSGLAKIVAELRRRYPDATIHGHREFTAKACPCFDVKTEYSNL